MRLLLTLALAIRRLYWRVVRPTTQGVRALVINNNQEVLLVSHKYGDGWLLPGGKVKKRESIENALKRELKEEIGLVIDNPPQYFGQYTNDYEYKRDKISVFIITSFSIKAHRHFEIESWRFFDPGMLPEGVSPGTRRRIGEWLGTVPLNSQW